MGYKISKTPNYSCIDAYSTLFNWHGRIAGAGKRTASAVCMAVGVLYFIGRPNSVNYNVLVTSLNASGATSIFAGVVPK